LARAVPLLNADRTVREWIGAIVDDDARKRSEDALQEEARIIETLHHVGSIVAAELDLEAIVRAVTDAATELSGAQFGAFFYNAVNEQGESYMLYTLSGVPREAFERFPLPRNTELFVPTFRGQGTVRLDDVIRDARYGKSAPYYGMPAGHLPVRSYLAVPVVSRSGEVLGGLFFGHPEPGVFTERAERLVVGIAAQAAVAIDNARLYAQAREAASAREQFLSIAAHELKTPLTTVKGSVQLLGRRLRQADLHDERILRLINQLERESERMETLVADLLDAARIQQGRLNLRTERVDLADLARQAIERFEEAPERTARHRLVLDAPSPVEGAWDPAMLDQMLTNLVSNGLRYSPDGGEVAIRVRAADAYAELSVSDHGIGISPDELPTVFQPFVRGASARQSVRGTGLGLHITARIVERHGGTISVESTPGAGSTFIVQLPLLQAASQGDRSEDVLITEPANPPLSATSPA
jgi:signal transduction histidine kinase